MSGLTPNGHTSRLKKDQPIINRNEFPMYLLKKLQIISIVLALCYFILPSTIKAETLEVPKINGYVAGSTENNLAIIVTWSTPDLNEYGYKIEKEGVKGKEIAATYNPLELGDSETTPGGFYFDAALVPNDTYTYYVTTFDRAGNESAPAKITLVAALCQPEFTTFDGKTDQGTVTLAWNPICSAAEYQLYRDGKLLTKIEETNYTDKNVPEGDHEYTVEAYKDKTTSQNFMVGRAMAADSMAKKTIKVNVTGGTKSPACAGKINTEFGWVCNLADYISKILNWIVGIAGGLALIMLIYAGYIYMTSQGKPERITVAKDIIISVIIGIVLLFLGELFLNTLGVIR